MGNCMNFNSVEICRIGMVILQVEFYIPHISTGQSHLPHSLPTPEISGTSNSGSIISIDSEDLSKLFDYVSNYSDYYEDNFNETDMDYKSVTPCVRQVCTPLSAWFLVFLGVIFFFAIIGNCGLLSSIVLKQTFLRPEVSFLLNVSLSHLMFAFTLPFFMVNLSSGWQIGDVACKAIQGIYQAGANAAGLFTAFLAIACWFPKQMGRPVLILVVCSVWGVALVLSLLAAKTYGVLGADKQVCDLLHITELKHLRTVSIASRLCTSSLVPLSSAAALFWHASHKTQGPALKRETNCIAIVILLFGILWTPFNVAALFDLLDMHPRDCEWQKTLDMILRVTESISLFHCCVTPILILSMKLHLWLHPDTEL